MELDSWAESDIPGPSLRCDWQTSRTSIQDLGRLREVIVGTRFAIFVGGSERCINGDHRGCIEGSDDWRP